MFTPIDILIIYFLLGAVTGAGVTYISCKG